MRARYFSWDGDGSTFIFVTELDVDSPDGVWRAVQGMAPASPGMTIGDVVYVGDQYFRLNNDGGLWPPVP
jgi:hypothetical protein